MTDPDTRTLVRPLLRAGRATRPRRDLALPDDLASSPLDHRWGPSPFHYTERAYQFLASRIAAFVGGGAPSRETLRRHLSTLAGHRGTVRRRARRDPSSLGAAQLFAFGGRPQAGTLRDGLVTVATSDVAPVDLLVEQPRGDDRRQPARCHGPDADDPADLHRAIRDRGARVSTGSSSRTPSLCLDPDLKLAWYLGSRHARPHAAAPRRHRGVQARSAHTTWPSSECPEAASRRSTCRTPFRGRWRCRSTPRPGSPTTTRPPGRPSWPCASAPRERKRRARRWTPTRGLTCGLSTARASTNHVIYLQNSQDAHVTTQLAPWLDALPHREGVHLLLRAWGRSRYRRRPGRSVRSCRSVAQVDGDWAELARRWDAAPATDAGSHWPPSAS